MTIQAEYDLGWETSKRYTEDPIHSNKDIQMYIKGLENKTNDPHVNNSFRRGRIDSYKEYLTLQLLNGIKE